MATDQRERLAAYLAGCDARYSPDQRMLGAPYHGPGYHTRYPDGAWAHATRESLDYALALLRSGETGRAERAAAIIARVLTLQETDPTARTYGIWPWLLEEPLAQMTPPDWNWADFCGARLAEALVMHGSVLPPELVAVMRASLGHAAWSIFRRNVGPGYTNIAIMGAAVTLAAGEILSEPRLGDYGRQRLRRIVEYTAEHGSFNEYNSPTYTLVALHECERILGLVRDPAARADAEALRRVAWQTIADHFHPGTAQWAGPHSRAYGLWLQAAAARYLAAQTGAAIAAHPAVADVPDLPSPHELPCPADLRDRFRQLPDDSVELRQRFIRRATDETSTWGVTWLTDDACLGSVNIESLWTQRHTLLGYWRTGADPAVALRLRFLHDGQDFASAAVWNAQHGPRVLSVIGLFSDLGDFHVSLDRPAGGIFAATDFRVRYELTGAGAQVDDLGGGRFALGADERRAVIHTGAGNFGPYVVRWEPGQEADRVFLDGICYQGARREFDLTALGPVRLVAGLELLGAAEPPAASAPVVQEALPGTLAASWVVSDGLHLLAPMTAVPYPRTG
jgi:hypothetical protein